MSRKTKDVQPVEDAALQERVREAIGKESLARLAAQPLATANGGIATILRTACKEAAGFPDPLAAAIAKTRVMCGSKGATPAKKQSTKQDEGN